MPQSVRGAKIRVVVADDSPVAREMLLQILGSDPDIEVVGTATNGQEAVDAVSRLRPDLITMDIHMPTMDGLEATERIMAYTPTPILVVSSSVYGEGMGRAFDALAIGALEVIKKPEPKDWAALGSIARDIIRTVKILSRVKVITHIRGRRSPQHGAVPIEPPASTRSRAVRLIAIGSSTGGPTALLNVLARLPEDLPVPVVIAQHIAEGFVPGLASWLDSGSKIKVVAAADGDVMHPGVAYMANTGSNMEVDGMTLRFTAPKPGQLYIPSADTLFQSVAVSYHDRAIGVLLTGMGADGAIGLKALYDRGTHTICQDEATSTVWGMPKAAIDLGAAGAVLPVHEIAGAIAGIMSGA
ncbi:MAG: chemotaxis-specific protein-glutamate methyltransferase CheB [Coriobacteriia bacterium]